MAEFQEVMKQWVRARKATASNLDGNVLSVYPLEEYDEDLIAHIEKNVMNWAAEHPEPVYPTFAEWMYDSFLKWCQGNYPGRAKDEKAWYDYIYETRIPADIAQKLGLQPKEAR